MPKIISILTFLLLLSAVELYLLIWAGRFIGPFNTVLFEVLIGVGGASAAKYMIKKDALAIRDKAAGKTVPVYEVISVIAVLMGAFFMLFPGLITDVAGILLLFPASRRIMIINFREKIKGSSIEETIKEKIVSELKKKGLFNN